MRKRTKHNKFKLKMSFKKCGAISCINNFSGLCFLEKCQFYENVLIQED
ncbi:hypothetical protein TXYLGN1_29210 [Tepidimicrobium xylanilyticum]|uniref:Uncharacterized protein n=1 Tax=Tepidimicrobium xylanilyticum TaxID=1123352 RepID=A0A1H2Y7F3_9FIRM|nr:hypothetical protein EN5CB1_18850 [Tepidimicrobium xylanilyticum]SDX00584.1 hypothetical protein SAMN05660923_01540 [Tepidimicrobium xylanilyticum]